MLTRKTLHAVAAGALLAAAAPAFADHGWDRVQRDRHVVDYRHKARSVVVERPVYIDRRVVVERPIYVERPVYIERPAPVYAPVYEYPQEPAYYPPVYDHGPAAYPARSHNPVGTVAGAAIGAVIGNQVGNRHSRGATTAIGAVIGGVLGSQF